ncbi:1-acyl-sn-glycerol-3-phosphate acyltransferase [Prevotella sp. S7 MS 2]|uniref:lysophospholipid acyltransferase family protein n=1 Tax=Prevotella sp. S7 MS 2 TaxID=1287488 RepID=UPI0005139266|nr:lysophospholipid acyltransferase family protein [Prevotella sp. S7 MS 2]KGI60777.1 acyl-phosphate glycerol 3-phosphate acyltransferase [Prevotella sp. S7 MS 2]
MVTLLYRIYQLCIALPVILIATILTALVTTIGCIVGNGHFWGYYPGRYWSWLITKILLLPVRVEGRENLERGQSYIFVSNHQGAFDIFLIYGYLHRNFKWMMKRQLRKLPFVGMACAAAHHIFVDKRGPAKVKETYEKARETLKGGMSMVVFPEGARTFTGHMGSFKRGAFMLADELQLPVVPLTINGSFDVMPRTRDMKWVLWHPLRLTIHRPIMPKGRGVEQECAMMDEAYRAVIGGLTPDYQGYVENPDQ